MSSNFLEWQNNDHYSLLGVTRMATEDEIRKAFRSRAKECHPDRLPLNSPQRDNADSQFKELTNAKDTLLDPELRAEYDKEQDLVQQSYLNAMVYDIPVTPRPKPNSFKSTLKEAFEASKNKPDYQRTDYLVGDEGSHIYSQPSDQPEKNPNKGRGIPEKSKQNLARFYYSQGLRFAARGMYRRALFALNQARLLDPEIEISGYLMSKVRAQAYYQRR